MFNFFLFFIRHYSNICLSLSNFYYKIIRHKNMAVFQFYKEQKIPTGIDEIWDFISSPANLKKITPDYMGFDISSDYLPKEMYPGMMISYRVKPIFNIKMNWLTEITQMQEKVFFIDEQRLGPYRIWHHEHRISKIEGGVRMTDLITYKPPFGFIGNLVNGFMIEKKIKEIFKYREKALIEIFGAF